MNLVDFIPARSTAFQIHRSCYTGKTFVHSSMLILTCNRTTMICLRSVSFDFPNEPIQLLIAFQGSRAFFTQARLLFTLNAYSDLQENYGDLPEVRLVQFSEWVTECHDLSQRVMLHHIA